MAASAEPKERPISIRMSPEGFADFMAVLSGAAAPMPEILELTKRPAPWEPGYAVKRMDSPIKSASDAL